MNYLLFNNIIYLSDGIKGERIEKADQLKEELESIDALSICVVDVDVELASAPEDQIEKKDTMLARKFSKLHPKNEYILQDEKIGDNIFQVIGIKAEKIREIYSLVPSSKVMVFIPYAIAIRNFLINKNIDLEKGIVFIDDVCDEKFITVFSGFKFSVTRTVVTNDIENILPEIKRSQIGFSKKIEEFDSWRLDNLTVLTNSQRIATHLSGNKQNIKIEYIEAEYPSIEGLKGIKDSDNLVRFLLPEEINGRKRKQELRQKAVSFAVSILIFGVGLGITLFNKVKLTWANGEYARLNQDHQILEKKLADLDTKTYREDLRRQKFLNYATPYLKILNILPSSYDVYSFRFYQTDHWMLEAFVYSKEKEAFEEIPRVSLLKNAAIKDYLIKDRPGKRMVVDL